MCIVSQLWVRWGQMRHGIRTWQQHVLTRSAATQYDGASRRLAKTTEGASQRLIFVPTAQCILFLLKIYNAPPRLQIKNILLVLQVIAWIISANLVFSDIFVFFLYLPPFRFFLFSSSCFTVWTGSSFRRQWPFSFSPGRVRRRQQIKDKQSATTSRLFPELLICCHAAGHACCWKFDQICKFNDPI